MLVQELWQRCASPVIIHAKIPTLARAQAMDGATLRRRLTRLGLPTSGKMSKLRERLREARDKA